MIAVDRRIISFLIIVAELNQDVIGFELDEFIQSLRQSLKGGAILRVVDDLCATIKPLGKCRSPTGLLRDGRITDETNGDGSLPLLTVRQALKYCECQNESHIAQGLNFPLKSRTRLCLQS